MDLHQQHEIINAVLGIKHVEVRLTALSKTRHLTPLAASHIESIAGDLAKHAARIESTARGAHTMSAKRLLNTSVALLTTTIILIIAALLLNSCGLQLKGGDSEASLIMQCIAARRVAYHAALKQPALIEPTRMATEAFSAIDDPAAAQPLFAALLESLCGTVADDPLLASDLEDLSKLVEIDITGVDQSHLAIWKNAMHCLNQGLLEAQRALAK